MFNTDACFTAQQSYRKRSVHLGNIFHDFFQWLNTDFLFKGVESYASNIPFHIVMSVPVDIQGGSVPYDL